MPPEKKIKPLITLTPEGKTKLKNLQEDIDQAVAAIEVMEKIGMDMTEAREKLEWSKNAREMLLENFG